MNNKKIALAIIPVVLGLVVLTGGVASAKGMLGFGSEFGVASNLTPDEIAARQTQMFQHQASILGVSIDVVKDAWARGLTLKQIISDNKLDLNTIQQNIKNDRFNQLKNYFSTLVAKGVITQSQADQKLSLVQQKTGDGSTTKGMGRGWQRGLGF